MHILFYTVEKSSVFEVKTLKFKPLTAEIGNVVQVSTRHWLFLYVFLTRCGFVKYIGMSPTFYVRMEVKPSCLAQHNFVWLFYSINSH